MNDMLTVCHTTTADLLRPDLAGRWGTRCRVHPEHTAETWPSIGIALVAALAPTVEWCDVCRRVDADGATWTATGGEYLPDMFAGWPEGASICQDDYEYATSTGQYAGNGYREYMEQHRCPRCRSLNHRPCYGLDITARECLDCGECYSAEA